MTVAKQKADAGFEVMEKLGIEYFCFHDTDLIGDLGEDIADYEGRMKEITAYLKEKMAETGIKNLWGTANVFGNGRYMNGAATNPDFDVVARAAVQIKNAIDATIALGGQNYVFWGGREGYMSLLNTDQKREKEHLAMMLTMARDYARAKGFTGTFLIEPKPMEPSKHQYDVDTETVIGFLKAHGLEKDFNTGAISTDPVNHEKMVNTRREKIARIADDIPALEVLGNPDADTLLIGWGGTYGHLRTATETLNAEGTPTAFAHFRYINPLPANALDTIRRYRRVIVAELNTGMFADYLQAKLPGIEILRINKIQGQPFQVSEIVEQTKNLIATK